MASETLDEGVEVEDEGAEQPLATPKESQEADDLFGTCQRYLNKEDNKEEQQQHQSNDDDLIIESGPKIEAFPVTEADLVEVAEQVSSHSSKTLPKKLGRKNSNKFVPKMRRVFERARSLEPPEVMQILVKVNMTPPPTPRLFRAKTPEAKSVLPVSTSEDQLSSDGTESVSSFVAVSNPSFQEDSESVASSSNNDKPTTKQRSFVNKCMSKVKHMFHVDQDQSKE